MACIFRPNKCHIDGYITCRALACRQKTGTCLIKCIIQGPVGATFPPGTASISYYVGRYDMLMLTNGERGGKEGMEAYVRDTFFAVVKADGPEQQWEADGDSTVSTRVNTAGVGMVRIFHSFSSVLRWGLQPSKGNILKLAR